MKMISHSRNKRSRGPQEFAVIIGMTIFVLAIVFTGLFSKAFYGTMIALTGAGDGAQQTAATFASAFASKAALQKENAALKRAIAERDVMLADRALLAKENADFRAAKQFAVDTGFVSAKVLSKPPFAPFDVLVIDAGISEGVTEGSRVKIGQSYIGTVTEVSDDTSRITLLSSPGSVREAFIGDEALPSLLKGKGGGNFETSLPLGSKVADGDLVFVYAGTEPFQVGKVTKIISDEDNTLMTILLTIPFNIYSLSHVEIVP